MNKSIKLFNNFHNGDVFYSRMILNILEKEQFKIEYHHNNKQNLLNDLEACNYAGKSVLWSKELDYWNDNIINTWIGKNFYSFLDWRGCTFENHKKIAMQIFNKLNIDTTNIINNDLLPVIYFQQLTVENIKQEMTRLKRKYKKIILICNGAVQSGQSINFNFDPIILQLNKDFDKFNYLFIITNNSNLNENIMHTSSIINDSENELLKISYLSTFCDIIIGRASGPYCFTHIKENLLSKNKKYISFTNRKHEGIWFEDSLATQIWSNNFIENNIISLIRKNIL